MTIRGNYKLFYFVEFLTGILLIFLCSAFGDLGLLGLILFFIALALTQKTDPDEREIALTYKISSMEGIVIGMGMAIIYFWFPETNWFYVLLYISLIAKGIIGYFTFMFA